MRRWLSFGLVLALVSAVGAQTISDQLGQVPAPAGLPAQNFVFFKCFCTTSPGAPLPNPLSFSAPPPRQWNGSVYATSSRDAAYKARNACTSERHTGLWDCIDCRCDR